MALYKNQHYVPRCHMKPFSIGSDGKQICLFNFNQSKLVNSAPMKHQCAKDYFYGADGKLEKAFQPIESLYASTIRNLPNNEQRLKEDQLGFLRDFALLQSLRTDAAAKQITLAHNEFYEMMEKKNPKALADLALDAQSIIHLTLGSFSSFRRTISDLKTCIVVNTTGVDFVTSDDPSIHTNRFHLQKIQNKTFGIGSSGSILVMPLTPKHLLLTYDPHVYMVPSILGSIVVTNEVSDIEALNSLQYIRSGANIFFQSWDNRDYIADQAKALGKFRPRRWWEVYFLVPDGRTATGERYRTATEEEVLSAERILVQQQAIFPEPPMWFSKLKWHPKPRFIKTGSAAGIIRPTAHFDD